MAKNRMLRCWAAGLLAAFCLAFARTDTTEKSMVRAVLLEPGEGHWTVGLLYQAPEASADSSEVSDGIRFAAAQGPDLERALASAEAALDRKSTRLNSSHVSCSYADFFFKKI